METNYTHPLADTETLEELAALFREKFELDAEATDEAVTIPFKVNWDAEAVIDLVEATPFAMLGYDEDEATVVYESELTE